jgi:hypothetical protein
MLILALFLIWPHWGHHVESFNLTVQSDGTVLQLFEKPFDAPPTCRIESRTHVVGYTTGFLSVDKEKFHATGKPNDKIHVSCSDKK